MVQKFLEERKTFDINQLDQLQKKSEITPEELKTLNKNWTGVAAYVNSKKEIQREEMQQLKESAFKDYVLAGPIVTKFVNKMMDTVNSAAVCYADTQEDAESLKLEKIKRSLSAKKRQIEELQEKLAKMMDTTEKSKNAFASKFPGMKAMIGVRQIVKERTFVLNWVDAVIAPDDDEEFDKLAVVEYLGGEKKNYRIFQPISNNSKKSTFIYKCRKSRNPPGEPLCPVTVILDAEGKIKPNKLELCNHSSYY